MLVHFGLLYHNWSWVGQGHNFLCVLLYFVAGVIHQAQQITILVVVFVAYIPPAISRLPKTAKMNASCINRLLSFMPIRESGGLHPLLQNIIIHTGRSGLRVQ